MKFFKFFLMVSVAFVISGCAANMPLSKSQDKIDVSTESIALVSVKISNQYKPGYQPGLTYAFLFPASEDAKKTHVSIKSDPVRNEEDKFNEYIVNVSLKPGTYNFAMIWGDYKVPLLMNAMCVIPLNATFEIKPNSVVYLGHIDAVIREKKDDSEPSAGSVVPLIDQAIAGFSTGTFDVAITDNFDEDMGFFLTEFPALATVNIGKEILVMNGVVEKTLAKAD